MKITHASLWKGVSMKPSCEQILEYAKDYLSQDNLKTLYAIYQQISVNKVKKQYFKKVLMNPSLFIKAQYSTAKEYTEKILPEISSSYQDEFYNFFKEDENLMILIQKALLISYGRFSRTFSLKSIH